VSDTNDPGNNETAPNRVRGDRSIALSNNRFDSRDLFAGTREVTIAHAGAVYRLRLTAQNKLILTK
jgi:hemin uptake protein HemP